MARVSIVPDSVKNQALIFLTTPQQLVLDTEVNAKIKRIVLEILRCIVGILTLGIPIQHCVDKRYMIESEMTREMLRSFEAIFKPLIYNSWIENKDVSEIVKTKLKEINGFSENEVKYILSHLDKDKLNHLKEKGAEILKEWEEALNKSNNVIEKGTKESEHAVKCVEIITSNIYKKIIQPNLYNAKLEKLEPLQITDMDKLCGITAYDDNSYDKVSEVKEAANLGVKTEDSYPVDEVYEILIEFWKDYETKKTKEVKDKCIESLNEIKGVSQKRAKSLIEFTIAVGEANKQVIKNNFTRIKGI